MTHELAKEDVEVLYKFARETNLLYLIDKFEDKFDKDTIIKFDLLLEKIYKTHNENI